MERCYYEDELMNLPEPTPKEVFELPEPEEVKGVVTPSGLKKPFLKIDDLEDNGPRKEIVIMEWLDFLTSIDDMRGMIEILSYYADLGWISNQVRNRLIDYARGFVAGDRRSSFSEIKIGKRKYKINRKTSEESAEGVSSEWEEMGFKAHLQSLIFILELIKDRIGEDLYKEALEKFDLT